MSRFFIHSIQAANSRALGALALCALLSSCGGGYQAPVLEQGRRQDVSAPEIISSNSADRVVDLSQRAPERRIELPGASVSTSTPVSGDSVAHTSPGRAIGRRVVTDASNAVASSGGSVAGATGNAAAAAGTHLVQAGDTLFSIAFQYDLDFRSLAITNGLQPPYTIFVGQELDLARSAASTASSVINSVGTPVSNNSAARSQATTGSSGGGVSRQPIGGVTTQAQSWAWPHQGRILRQYSVGSNKGIDIAGNVGDPVRAASAGDVVYSGRGVQGSGNLIIIRHSDRYLSAYAHNSAMLASEGMHVEAGDIIAEVGMNPAGDAMLHFEIRRDGQATDPLQYLPAR